MMRSLCVLLCLGYSIEALRMVPQADEYPQLTKESGEMAPVPQLTKSLEQITTFDEIAPVLAKGTNQDLASVLFGKGGDDSADLHQGEAEFLMGLLREAGTTPEEYQAIFSTSKQEHMGTNYNMTGHMKTVHHLSVKEEIARGTDYGHVFGPSSEAVGQWMWSGLSDFGNAVPKYPRSWVEPILNMSKDAKQYRYMFSGSFSGGKFRTWVKPWVAAHFDKDDYFRTTEAGSGYKPMGAFDYSKANTGAFRPKNCGGACMKFDQTYWEQMAHSKFILAPGGDAPYSFRFFEAFLSKAIPVINSFKGDWANRASTKWVTSIGYDFAMTSEFPHTFDEKVAELNQKKFIRYQTLLEGDFDPVKDQKDGTYQKLFGSVPEQKH